MTDEKVCCICAQSRPISEFGINARNKDGLRSDCKICRKAQYDKTKKSPHRIAEENAVKARQNMIVKEVAECGTLTMAEIIERLGDRGINNGMVGQCIKRGLLVGHRTELRNKNCNVILTYTVAGVDKPEVREREPRINLWDVWPVSVPATCAKPRSVHFDDHWHGNSGMVAPGASLIQSSMSHLMMICGE